MYKVSGQGPPLLYLPGLDGTGDLFYRQESELAQAFTVVTFSLRSQGEFSYQDLIEDVAAIIVRLGSQPVTLCGESFGGTLALQFALSRPQMVERLVVINSFPYFRNRWLLNTGRILLEFTPYEFIQLGRIAATQLGFLAEDLPPADCQKFLEISTQVTKLGVAQRLSLIADYDVRDRLKLISTPALFIASRLDRLQNSVQEAEYMAAQIPGAKTSIIEKMGHVPLPAPGCSLYKIMSENGFLPDHR